MVVGLQVAWEDSSGLGRIAVALTGLQGLHWLLQDYMGDCKVTRAMVGL